MAKIIGKNIGDTPGMMKDFFGSAASVPSGYLACDGSTIGSAASGATALASALALNLYTIIWNSTSNSDIVIQTSAGSNTTRGASAAADFAANKRLPLPNSTRKVHVGAGGSGTGTLGNTIGNTGGEEAHTLSSGEVSHTHGSSSLVALANPVPGVGIVWLQRSVAWGANVVTNGVGIGSGSFGTNSLGTAIVGNTDGPSMSNSAHNIIQPSLIVTRIIKY